MHGYRKAADLLAVFSSGTTTGDAADDDGTTTDVTETDEGDS